MPLVTVGHHPELTPDGAVVVFRDHFAGKYKVYGYRSAMGRASSDFIIEDTGLRGVRARLKQDTRETSFLLAGYVPSRLRAFILGCILIALLRRPSIVSMVEEVRLFVENATEFK